MLPISVKKFPHMAIALGGRVDLYHNQRSFVSVMLSEDLDGLDKMIFKPLP